MRIRLKVRMQRRRRRISAELPVIANREIER